MNPTTWFEAIREFGYPTAVSIFLAWLLLKVGRWLATKADDVIDAFKAYLAAKAQEGKEIVEQLAGQDGHHKTTHNELKAAHKKLDILVDRVKPPAALLLIAALLAASFVSPGLAVGQVAGEHVATPAAAAVVIDAQGNAQAFDVTANTDAGRGAAAIAALAAAKSGDGVHLGPGTFALGSAVAEVPNGVSLFGSGIGATTLSTTNSTKTCICPGNNSLIADLTVSVGSGGYPIGSNVGASQKASTGVVFRNVRTLGGIDGIIYTHTATNCTFTAYDCEFVSGWDTCYVRNVTATMFNCTFDANPSFGAGSFGYGQQCNGPQINDAAGELTIIGGKVRVAGGSANNRGALCTLGTLRLVGVQIDATGTGAAHLVRAGGTLYAARVSTPTGSAIATSGTINWADNVAGIAPGASGLAALAATNAAGLQTAAGTVIGTNVQAYDADLTTFAGISPSANVQTILNAADYAAIRTALSLVTGTNVQAYDADLTTFAGITPSANVQTLLGSANYAAFLTSLGGQPIDAGLTALAGGSDFVAFTGPTTATKTFTLPNASATVLTDNALVTVAQGGTGANSFTANRILLGNGTSAITTNTAIVFDGTGLSTGRVLIPNAGQLVGPGANLMEFRDGTGSPIWDAGSSASWNGMILGSGYHVGWSSSTNPSGAGRDTSLTRTAAGVIQANAASSIGTLHAKRVRTATATSATVDNTYQIVGVTSTAAARTITLQPAATATAGFVLIVKDESGGAGTNNITIDANASETIDGSLTKAINTNYGSIRIYCDGANWFTY